MLSKRTRTALIGVITAVWVVNFSARLFLPDYEPSGTIDTIFMAIVGGLLAVSERDRKKTEDDDVKGEGDK